MLGATKKVLAPIKSITGVAETFHYSMLAALLLQLKARRRNEEILINAPADYSITTMIKTQLGVDDNKSKTGTSCYGDHFDSEILKTAKLMEMNFAYSGRAMRAMALVSIMQICTCRSNRYMNPYAMIKEYEPTEMLILSKDYSVIGYLDKEAVLDFSNQYSHSIRPENIYSIKGSQFDFGKIFLDKTAEIFSLQEMDNCDRARTEELRDFYSDTLCRAFFELRFINFPRVLNVIDAINTHSNEKGLVSDELLSKIIPEDCKNLITIQSILIKDSVDLDKNWYRINNGGILNFRNLTRRLNLLGIQKQDLLEKVVSNMKI